MLTATKGGSMKRLTEEQQEVAVEAMKCIQPAVEFMCRMYPGIRVKLQRIDVNSIAALAICKAARSYDETKGTYLTYFSTAIRNELLKYLERNCGDTLDKPGRVPLFADTAAINSHHGPLQVAISSLSDDDIALIRLRYWQCLSYPEIAKRRGSSNSTTRRRVAAALDRLRNLVDSPRPEQSEPS